MSRHSHVHQSRDSRIACQCITGLTLNQKSLENGREVSRGVTAILMLRGLGHDMAHGVLAHECEKTRRFMITRLTLILGSCTLTCTVTATPRYLRSSKREYASLCLRCESSSASPFCPISIFFHPIYFILISESFLRSYLSTSSLQFASHRVQVCADLLRAAVTSHEWFCQCMWRNTNPVYGTGFRAANAGLQVAACL